MIFRRRLLLPAALLMLLFLPACSTAPQHPTQAPIPAATESLPPTPAPNLTLQEFQPTEPLSANQQAGLLVTGPDPEREYSPGRYKIMFTFEMSKEAEKPLVLDTTFTPGFSATECPTTTITVSPGEITNWDCIVQVSEQSNGTDVTLNWATSEGAAAGSTTFIVGNPAAQEMTANTTMSDWLGNIDMTGKISLSPASGLPLHQGKEGTLSWQLQTTEGPISPDNFTVGQVRWSTGDDGRVAPTVTTFSCDPSKVPINASEPISITCGIPAQESARDLRIIVGLAGDDPASIANLPSQQIPVA